MIELLTAVGGIILVDLTLSGDNALVIGAAASRLPPKLQRRAIAVGGAGALVLRVLFGGAATLLLKLPLLRAIGGVMLLLVALRLIGGMVRESQQPANDEMPALGGKPTAEQGFWAALVTIVMADVTMSLDNVLAVGALASGNVPVLAGGLLLSMMILLVGSTLVARLIGHAPWLVDVAAVVLGYTAGQMVAHDVWLHPVVMGVPSSNIVLPLAGIAGALVGDMLIRWNAHRMAQRRATARAGEERLPEPLSTAPRRAS